MGGERLRSGGFEQKGKRTHGHGQQCGDCWEEEGIRGLNGNGKIQQSLNLKNFKMKDKSQMILSRLSKTI